MPGVLQVNLLGPLEVVLDGVPVSVPGLRLRVLLIRLATAGGRSVSASALVDDVWGDEPPADPANALQSLVSRLRRVLGRADAAQAGAASRRLGRECRVSQTRPASARRGICASCRGRSPVAEGRRR